MPSPELRVPVSLGERSYDILISSDRLGEVGGFAASIASFSRAVVVTDPHAEPYAGVVAGSLREAGIESATAVVPAGERSKCLERVAELYDRMVDCGADRKTLVVAVGGGVIGDLAGFVAATFVRGLALLQVPTTLLAQVDSSVGGKVGVNHPKGKNLIGAFHQPVGVWIDTSVLATLPDREYRCGLAEIVKYGVILDAEFFGWLETNAAAINAHDADALRHAIARSCRLKASVVEQDERELTGVRAALNYGHTFAHAYETLTGYDTLRHGEAVAAGMIAASRLAERIGRIDATVTARQTALLEAFGLPTSPPPVDVEEAMQVMRRDKKAMAGRLRFVLASRLGEVELVEDVDPDIVRAVLEEANP